MYICVRVLGEKRAVTSSVSFDNGRFEMSRGYASTSRQGGGGHLDKVQQFVVYLYEHIRCVPVLRVVLRDRYGTDIGRRTYQKRVPCTRVLSFV